MVEIPISGQRAFWLPGPWGDHNQPAKCVRPDADDADIRTVSHIRAAPLHEYSHQEMLGQVGQSSL
eukprot:4691-Amphidinium_carterae.1